MEPKKEYIKDDLFVDKMLEAVSNKRLSEGFRKQSILVLIVTHGKDAVMKFINKYFTKKDIDNFLN